MANYQTVLESGKIAPKWVGKSTKVCPKCGVEKSLEEFKWHPVESKYYPGWCGSCENEKNLENYYIGGEEAKEKNKQRSKKWRENNPEKVQANRESLLQNYHEGGGKERKQEWLKNGGGRKHYREYTARRRREDLQFKIKGRLRNRMWAAIKNKQKTGSAVRDLGCSIPEFIVYIENQFQDEMTWSNWGEVWELDHIRPLASFDLEDREQFLQAAHYSNYQPLRTFENRSKGARL